MVNKTKSWVALIRTDNKLKKIGTYKTSFEAAKAYDSYIIKNNLKNILNFDIDTNSNIKNILIKQYRKKVVLRKNLIYNDLIRNKVDNLKLKKELQKYVDEISQDIENLKANNGFKDEKKVQVVSTLRDVLLRLEMILEIK